MPNGKCTFKSDASIAMLERIIKFVSSRQGTTGSHKGAAQ